MKTKLLYVFLFISTFAYAQFPTNGLIAQYGFDNGSLADGANGNNFTQTGTSLTQVDNRFNTTNNAVTINSDYLTRPDVAFSNSRLSYNFWIKTSTNDVNKRTIIDNSTRTVPNGFNSDGYYIYIENGRLGVYATYDYTCSTVNVGVTNLSNYFVADGSWHNVTVSFWKNVTNNTDHIIDIKIDDFAVERVVNGFSTNNPCVLNYSFDINSNVVIGNNAATNLPAANRYEDAIDDILIYNRLLTEAEMSSIANYNDFCFSRQASDITINAITETTANIELLSTGTFDVAYALKDAPFSSATIITNITSGNTQLSGLMSNTFYDVYIKEQCATSTSGWSAPKSFSTERPYGRLYVNQNATGTSDGLSWANAFTNLQSALTEVIAGEEIWISSGTYTPHASNRGIYFVINKEDLKLYGGFDGTETQLADRTIGVNETILSADLQANDVNVSDYPGNYANTTRNADNSYRVVNITAAGNNLLLDGLTISDAHNNASTTTRGAAIAKDKTISHLTLRNCVVKDNVCRNDNAGLVAEFELNNTSGTRGELIIENCQFVDNMSRWASGIYSFVRGNTNVDITVANTLFDGNIAADLSSTVTGISGSASWFRVLTNGSNITLNLTNNTYVNNIDLGTAQSVNNFSRATVAISKPAGISSVFNASVNNCIFWENTTAGGVTTRSITDQYTSPANSLIINNSLDPLSFNDDSITSTNTIINSNPLFTNSANNDFTLTSISPAVDTGDNVYVLGATDLLGNQRILNSTVDMGAYEFDSSTLGVNDMSLGENDIKLYPNPTSSILNIEMNTILKKAIIVNIQGQRVIESVSNQLDVSSLSNGLYIIKIEDENGNVSTKRFLKN